MEKQEFEVRRIYKGDGVFKLDGRQVGQIMEVDFIFQHLGFDSHNSKSYYGTVDGNLEDYHLSKKKGLEIDATVREVVKPNDPAKNIRILNVGFIDEVPRTGILKRLEFHGEHEP